MSNSELLEKLEYFNFEAVEAVLKDSEKTTFMKLLEQGVISARARFFDPDISDHQNDVYQELSSLVWRDFWHTWSDESFVLYHPEDQGRFFSIELHADKINGQFPWILDRLSGSEIKINTSPGTRKTEIHHEISVAIVSLKKENGVFPSARDVWRHLEKNVENIECIQESAADGIYWISQWGHEQKLSYANLKNIVSLFKTGKKPLPDL